MIALINRFIKNSISLIPPKSCAAAVLGLILAGHSFVVASSQANEPAPVLFASVIQKSPELPVTFFNLTFQVGSADDPQGLEGLATLTSRMLREGGVKALNLAGHELLARTRAALEDVLFPLAAEIDVSTARQQIAFMVPSTAANAREVLEVLAQMLLNPAFDSAEFERIKAETLDALTQALPREDEEELGKAALEQRIYGPGHPYSHIPLGSIEGVRRITLEHVREFYRTRFTQKRLTVGIAGVVPESLETLAKQAFSSLPGDVAQFQQVIPPAPVSKKLTLTLVKGEFDSVGAHLGQPLLMSRSNPEFPALLLASWGFGKHRSFVGRLMHVVREVRSLNYGAYSYVEEFPGGGGRLSPPTQAARTRQAFTVWARPTTPPNACFMVRQVYREVKNLAKKGLTAEEFKLTQSHLIGTAPLLASGLEQRLGYAIDSRFYGISGDYLLQLQASARRLTRDGVNAELRKTLHPETMEIVVVTPDPAAFQKQILSPECTVHYAPGVKKPADVLAEDRQIERFSLGLKPEDIRVVSAESVFR